MNMRSTILFALLVSISQRSQAYVSRLRSKPLMKIRPKYVLSTDQMESFVNGNETDDISTALGQQCNRPRLRKRWGIDNEYREEYWMTEYWFDNRIHTLGNIGFLGAFHAAVAGLSTMLIDVLAYEGTNVRQTLAAELSKEIGKDNIKIVDLCCGVGFSTRALQEAFPNSASVVGVDTSPEMVAMAEFLTDHTDHLKFDIPNFLNLDYVKYSTLLKLLLEQKNIIKFGSKRAIKYLTRNAENTLLPSKSFNLVTIMYAFHEVPNHGRDKILAEARRLLIPGGTLAVVDICTDFMPPPSMLLGEPYVLEYQQNIHKQLRSLQGFRFSELKRVLPGHVSMWILKRTDDDETTHPSKSAVTEKHDDFSDSYVSHFAY